MLLHKFIWIHCARLYGHLIHLYTAMIWVVKVFLAPIKVHWRCHFTTLLTWRMLSFDLPLNDVQITILSQQDIYVKIKGVYRTGFFSSVKYLVCAQIAIYLFFFRESWSWTWNHLANWIERLEIMAKSMDLNEPGMHHLEIHETLASR